MVRPVEIEQKYLYYVHIWNRSFSEMSLIFNTMPDNFFWTKTRNISYAPVLAKKMYMCLVITNNMLYYHTKLYMNRLNRFKDAKENVVPSGTSNRAKHFWAHIYRTF